MTRTKRNRWEVVLITRQGGNYYFIFLIQCFVNKQKIMFYYWEMWPFTLLRQGQYLASVCVCVCVCLCVWVCVCDRVCVSPWSALIGYNLSGFEATSHLLRANLILTSFCFVYVLFDSVILFIYFFFARAGLYWLLPSFPRNKISTWSGSGFTESSRVWSSLELGLT